MKKLTTFILLLLFAVLTFAQVNDTTNFKFPEPIGYVNDYEGVFSEEQISELVTLLAKYEEETTNQIFVLTITSYEPYETLEKFSLDLANEWRVGQAEKDNGIVLIFGKQFRKIRIEVGLGLEEKLTDAEAKFIIDNIIIPEFKQNDYFTGIKNGIQKIIEEIK